MTSKKPETDNIAYFKTIIHNSIKNEYRQNATQTKHAVPYGDHPPEIEVSDTMIEETLTGERPENWLMFIESPQLHRALSTLRPQELDILHMLYVRGFTPLEVAEQMGTSRQVIHNRKKRILRKLKKKILKKRLPEGGVKCISK